MTAAIAFPNNEQYRPGAIVVHRKDGDMGRLAYSTFGLSVCGRQYVEGYGNAHFQTLGEPVDVVSKHWRIATDEEVRRYFDAN